MRLQAIDDDLLRQLKERFKSFRAIPFAALSSLKESLERVVIQPGETILKAAGSHTDCNFYLINGEVEVRHSFEQRISLLADERSNNSALNDQLVGSGFIRAVRACELLKIEKQLLELLLQPDEQYSLVDVGVDGIEFFDTEIISDDSQKDWQLVFIQSPMAVNLPAQAIEQLFTCMENIEVSAGDVLIRERSEGEFFYLIKRGEVIINTDKSGAYCGETVLLEPGQYFGDEALVADTVRNATVSMQTDGLVGRINRQGFERIIKANLVTYSDIETNRSADIIDIRFPLERQQQNFAGSLNIPITMLRKGLSALNHDRKYLVAPANDCRSELATYLLRQAGFDASTLRETVVS
jgi:CRP-like cAMP-binding protein